MVAPGSAGCLMVTSWLEEKNALLWLEVKKRNLVSGIKTITVFYRKKQIQV